MHALLGFLLLVVLVVIGVGSGQVAYLIDPASGIIVGAMMITACMASFGPRRKRILGILFGKTTDRQELLYGMAVCGRARTYCIAGGVLGTMIGCMIILRNMDDPAAIGPGMAIMLLTQLYAIMLGYGILLPLSLSLKRRLDDLRDDAEA